MPVSIALGQRKRTQKTSNYYSLIAQFNHISKLYCIDSSNHCSSSPNQRRQHTVNIDVGFETLARQLQASPLPAFAPPHARFVPSTLHAFFLACTCACSCYCRVALAIVTRTLFFFPLYDDIACRPPSFRICAFPSPTRRTFPRLPWT